MNRDVHKNGGIAFFMFLAFLILSVLSQTFFVIKPNIYIVFIAVISFFISDFWIYFVYSLLAVLWMKFSTFFAWEYLSLVICAVLAFIIGKYFLYKKNFVSLAILILVFQIIFWVSVGVVNQIYSLVFLLELVYNIIIGELLFMIGLWLKRIYL